MGVVHAGLAVIGSAAFVIAFASSAIAGPDEVEPALQAAPRLIAPPTLVSKSRLGGPAASPVMEAPVLPRPSALPTEVPAAIAAPAVAPKRTSIKPVPGVWVEGPGFEVTYGGNYDGCAKRCLDNTSCLMIEYYKPEKKCNLYNTMRPHKVGGASIVGVRG